MTKTLDETDRLLLIWYAWENGHKPSRLGYPPTAAFALHYRSGEHWGDRDDLDERIRRMDAERISRIIGPIVQSLDQRLRIAISTAMKNHGCGAQVFRTPRLTDWEAAYLVAKLTIRPRLESAGLV